MPTATHSVSPGAVNPLELSGWAAALESSPLACTFHTPAWAKVLTDTYGHVPYYVFCRTDDPRSPMLPLMEVSSGFTGRRGVSLPFSDFCPPLANDPAEFDLLHQRALDLGRRRGWRYLELRGNFPPYSGAEPFLEFFTHRINLRRGAEAAFAAFTPAVRRGIRKAGEAGLRVEVSDDAAALEKFWPLHVSTRRRHGLPPQPLSFFKNIGRHVFSAGQGCVVLVFHHERPVAAAVFFSFGSQAIYKFGASDSLAQQLRPNNLLMWEATRHFAARNCAELHLGRTSLVQEGLRRFKLGFGAAEEKLRYYRHDYRTDRCVRGQDQAVGWHNVLFRKLPLPLLKLAGRVLYPHLS